ncbi:MAG: 6,7-dimethyl-8-ribityllumazine synthase [Limisphaerales bacterium]|jgi:6,7-dimethyl-8-ribityllumazine synthase
MATAGKNLSDTSRLPDGRGMQFGLVTAQWNDSITDTLLKSCIETLHAAGVDVEDIRSVRVPGSFELASGAQMILENVEIDAVICLGCVIQGETKHDDYISNAVAGGLMELGLNYGVPVIFGLLTTNTEQQAIDRAGGAHGNKGIEAAATALQMVALHQQLESEKPTVL